LAAALDELEWKSLARRRLETFEEEIHAGNYIYLVSSSLYRTIQQIELHKQGVNERSIHV
jgi:Fe-S oxidoreductase